MRKYYLVTTKHLEDGLWFRGEIDFVTGMNYVAIQAAMAPEIIVLAFILMSNHVHFVLYGTHQEVEAFVNNFKGRFSHYLSQKYHMKEFLRRNKLDIKEIPEAETESLERTIAYVQMNCVAASICLYPGQYSWGTGSTFFQAEWKGMSLGGKSTQCGSSGFQHFAQKYRRLGDLSGRERILLMHSRTALKLPDEWLLSESGFVLPESYVDVNQVESVFHSPANSALNVPSGAFSNVPSVTDSNVPLQTWLL